MVRRNLVKEGPSNTQPARLPAITIPASTDPALKQTLEAIKERLEVREGGRGNPYEKVVTFRDLEDKGITQGGQYIFGSSSGSSSGSLVGGPDVEAVKREVAELRTKVLNLPLTKTLSSPIDTGRIDSEISRLNARVEAIRTGLGLDVSSSFGQISASVAQEALDRRKAVAREAVIRADQISIEAHQRLIGVQEAANAALAAAIAADNERTDRIADVAIARTELSTDIQEGLSAEAAERTLLAAQLRGGYTGNDLSQVTTGLLYEERVARANQDNALALQITLLSAGVGEQFDWAQIWYYDTGVEGWGGNGTPTVVNGWLRPANQASNAYVTSPAGLNLDAPKYRQVRLRLRKVGTPTFAGFLWWNGVAQSWDVSRRLAITEPAFDGNGIGVLTINTEWTGTIDQLRLDLSSAQTVTDYFEIDWFAVGRPSPGASTAQLLAEQEARAAADSAEVTARETLATAILGQADPTGLNLGNLTQGLIYDERVARSTAVGAVASDLTLLEGSVTTLDGEVQTLSGTVTSLSEVVADVEAVSVQNSLELVAVRKDVDIDAEALLRNVLANENTRDFAVEEVALAKQELTADIQAGLSAEAAQRLLLSAIVSQNSADIVSEQIARADGDSALASDISALTATVGANTAAITAEQTARADADSALSSSLTALIAQTADDAEALVVAEQLARTTADSALASDISALTTRVGDAEADIITEQTARSTADSALASDISALTTRVGTAEADILTEQSARISGDSANATSITSLSTRLDNAGGTGVTVEQQFTAQSSINTGLLGQYSVKIDVNGFVSGFGLSSQSVDGTPTSDFQVLANRFSIVSPSVSMATVTSLTRSGTTATLTTSTAHGLEAGEYVAIRGVTNDLNWNRFFAIASVPSSTQLTFTVANTLTTPATGTIKAGRVNVPFVIDGTKIALSGDVKINGNLVTTGSLHANRITAGTLTLDRLVSGVIWSNAITANAEAGSQGVQVNGNNINPAILGNNFEKGAGVADVFKGGIIGHAVLNSATNAGAVGVAGVASDGGVGKPAFGVRGEVADGTTGSAGVYGYARSGSATAVGVRGVSAITSLSGFGVVGELENGGTAGVAAGVYAKGKNTTPALQIDGRVLWRAVGGSTPVTITNPPDNTTTFLRGDGSWSAPATPIEVERLISKNGGSGSTNSHRFYAYWTGTTLEFWVDSTRIIRLTPSTQAVNWN